MVCYSLFISLFDAKLKRCILAHQFYIMVMYCLHILCRGFGAKLDGEVRHAFALSAGQVNGIDGVLETYQAAFTTGFIMSRPTDITQVTYFHFKCRLIIFSDSYSSSY